MAECIQPLLVRFLIKKKSILVSAKIRPICVDREEGWELLPLQKDADWTSRPPASGESGVQNAKNFTIRLRYASVFTPLRPYTTPRQAEKLSACNKIIPNKKGHVIPEPHRESRILNKWRMKIPFARLRCQAAD